MGVKSEAKDGLLSTGRLLNEAISFVIFFMLDLLDFILCCMFKTIDFLVESDWKYFYRSSAKGSNTNGDKMILSPPKIVRLSYTKLHLEEISDTLFLRPWLVSEVVSKFSFDYELKKVVKFKGTIVKSSCEKKNNNNGVVRSTFTVNSTVIEMLRGKIGGQHFSRVPRWSDCHCMTCNSLPSQSSRETLFVRVQEPKDNKAQEDVLFIHGFISSSSFWTETLFPNFSTNAKSTYRLIAFDLLGFGRSPKPRHSLYTLREHLDVIERSVIGPHNVKSCHVVAHSLGCIFAIALAVKHPGLVKSLTLLAPPYYPVPKGEHATQYVMRKVAPRQVWPLITFGASIACWYEHITRTVCLVVSKNHRFWEFLTKLITRNRVKQYLLESFFCHTHNAAWHTLHNILCGTGGKLDLYLDAVRDRLTCDVNIIHGGKDELVPIQCSYNVQSRVPRARVKLLDNRDHITIVLGRQNAFASDLEEIWKRSNGEKNLSFVSEKVGDT